MVDRTRALSETNRSELFRHSLPETKEQNYNYVHQYLVKKMIYHKFFKHPDDDTHLSIYHIDPMSIMNFVGAKIFLKKIITQSDYRQTQLALHLCKNWFKNVLQNLLSSDILWGKPN